MQKRRKRKKRRYATNKDRVYTIRYKKWIKDVFKRDGFQCVLCSSSKGIQAHHIVRHADSTRGRYLITNGCVLCYECHKKVTGKETYYAPMLRKIIRKNAE